MNRPLKIGLVITAGDLVMAGPNEYRWHRTDWPANSYTIGVLRCGADSASGD